MSLRAFAFPVDGLKLEAFKAACGARETRRPGIK